MSIADVRRFNRAVATEIGALDERFLGLDRPMAESRLIWEIGSEGAEVRALRSRLKLDSGYLSRLLRALERADLVTVETHPDDGRTRVVELTSQGRRERAVLDERSDQLAAALLAPLSETQQDDLVVAMRTVERLLTAGLVELVEADPRHPDAQRCIAAYFAELDRRSGGAFDPVASDSAPPDTIGLQLVAYLRGEAVGCGALKHHDGWGEIKRLWVADAVRGLGVGRRLLQALEAHARGHGARLVRLDTNKHLTEAIAMYRSHGYVEIPAFNDEPFAHHWFEKTL